MTWKLYALSGGAFLATYVMSLTHPFARIPAEPLPLPQAVNRSGDVVDLSAQADRLRARIAEAARYTEPSRDAFRFGASPRQIVTPPAAPPVETPSTVAPPIRPPFALAGMSSTVEGEVTHRTAILTSLGGILLVREGDLVEGGYRVVRIDDESVTVEATSDGTPTTLRLSGSESR